MGGISAPPHRAPAADSIPGNIPAPSTHAPPFLWGRENIGVGRSHTSPLPTRTLRGPAGTPTPYPTPTHTTRARSGQQGASQGGVRRVIWLVTFHRAESLNTGGRAVPFRACPPRHHPPRAVVRRHLPRPSTWCGWGSGLHLPPTPPPGIAAHTLHVCPHFQAPFAFGATPPPPGAGVPHPGDDRRAVTMLVAVVCGRLPPTTHAEWAVMSGRQGRAGGR